MRGRWQPAPHSAFRTGCPDRSFWRPDMLAAMTDFSWPEILGVLASGSDLSRRQARQAMRQVMSGEASPARIATAELGLINRLP